MTPCPNRCQCSDHRVTRALGTFNGQPHVADPGQQDETHTWREYFLALFVLAWCRRRCWRWCLFYGACHGSRGGKSEALLLERAR
jgi:hypothetical protein